VLSRTSSGTQFKNHAGIHRGANSRAVKRAAFVEQQTGCGKLVVAGTETVNHALGPDAALEFQLENCTTVRGKAAKLRRAVKRTLPVHSQACPGKASVAPACEGMKNSLRPDTMVTSRGTQFEDGTNAGSAADYGCSVQIAPGEYQATQRTQTVVASSERVERFLGLGTAVCGLQPEDCARAGRAAVRESTVE
jgi:hypothetical protein